MKRQYLNAPVIEALCEVYFRESEWDTTIPGIFYERVSDEFPNKSERMGVEIELSLAAEVLATRTRHPEPRSQFSRSDGSRMLQIGRDLLVVNQVRPYPHFGKWRPAVLDAVSLYEELAKPKGVERIGMRYINRIEIPGETLEMAEYFGLYPEIPERIGSSHGAFMMRVEVPSVHERHQLMVTFGSAPQQTKGSRAFLLDLYDMVVPTTPIGSVEEYLDEAHENIERLFESIITDSTRTIFGEN